MEIKKTPLLQLGARINEIESEIQRLQIEYNMIIDEIHERIPTTKDEPNLQKKKVINSVTELRW